MSKLSGVIIGVLCFIVAVIIGLDLLPLSSDRAVYTSIYILLGNLFITREGNNE